MKKIEELELMKFSQFYIEELQTEFNRLKSFLCGYCAALNNKWLYEELQIYFARHQKLIEEIKGEPS